MATIRYKKESDKWFVDFRRGFTRKRIHFKTRREAEDFKRALLLRKSGLSDLPSELSEISLKEAVERYKTTITSTKGIHSYLKKQTNSHLILRMIRVFMPDLVNTWQSGS